MQHLHLFPLFSALAVALFLCNSVRLEWPSAAEHISPSPLPPALSRDLPFSLSLSLPPSFPPLTRFLLDSESYSAEYREQQCWRSFSYLPVPAGTGEEGNIFSPFHFSPLDLTSRPQSSVPFPLLFLFSLALRWNTNDYSGSPFATSCPASLLLAAFWQRVAQCHHGNVTLWDRWIYQLLTWVLFWRKGIIISFGRAYRLAVIEAAIRRGVAE